MTEKPWQQRAVLEELYVEQGLTQKQVGERLGCSQKVVAYWMDKHDMDTRGYTGCNHVPYRTDQKGYGWWQHHYDGSNHSIGVHRLLMTLEYDLSEFEGKHVHHKNRIPWDNRPENLELLTHSEHRQEHEDDPHRKEREFPIQEWHNSDRLQSMYDNDMSMYDIAREFDISYGTVDYWMRKHDINRRERGDAISDGKNNGERHKDKQVLKELHHERDMTQSEMADELDTSQSVVGYWLRKHGLTKDQRRVGATPEKINEMYSGDTTQQDVADEMECSVTTVRKKLRQGGYL